MVKASKIGFFSALGIVVYAALVSLVMNNANELFGHANQYLSQIAFLALLSLSAAVVGGLVLGKPFQMYLDGKKKEAVSLFLQTIGWLAAFTAILIGFLVLNK